VLVTSLPQIAAGRVKPLALTSDQRSPHAPDIPSMPEAGVKGFNEAGSDLWFGVVGPAGIPKPIVAILNAKLIEALNQPDLRARIKAQAFDVWTSTPEEFARVVERDRASWGKIVKASGATVD
jgi:tripartite-type tricarboxylate transporter receptor subunit TctC